MITNITPSNKFIENTLNSLRYAEWIMSLHEAQTIDKNCKKQ